MDNLVQDLIGMAKAAGPFATVLMLYLYWRVDSERKELTAQLLELTKNFQTISDSWMKILDKTRVTSS